MGKDGEERKCSYGVSKSVFNSRKEKPQLEPRYPTQLGEERMAYFSVDYP